MSALVSLREKIAYALGDGAANIAWRGVSTFLLIFYTDVFGLTPATVGLLMLVARLSDGVSDIAMGIVGDHTRSKYGKFRPWILWTAIPLGVILSLLFTAPDWSEGNKIVYAYVTYILFTLIYTANNIPYGALMAVMTSDDKERTSIGSFRMVGAFAGGMVVQGALLFLVSYFGNVDPKVEVKEVGKFAQEVSITLPKDIEHVNIQTVDNIATFRLLNDSADVATTGKSLSGVRADETYVFSVEGEENLTSESFRIIDQSQGYSKAIYVLSAFLSIFLILTFLGTRERVQPPKTQKSNIGHDLVDLVTNRPWLVLLVVGLLFNIYNNIKQGVTVIYFTHYIHNQLLAATYMIALMIASIAGAMATAKLSRVLGKKRLFIYALIFSGAVNACLALCTPSDIAAIFVIGTVSEVAAAIFPTLFFAMLGDAADYSEFVHHRRATGLVYSAGSFATKFGGGIACAVIGGVLAYYGYNGQDSAAIEGAAPGIIGLMSVIPAVFVVVGAVLMLLYPLDQKKSDEITRELQSRREAEIA